MKMRSVKMLLFAGLMQLSASPWAADPQRAIATFAGGCFWCMEQAFDEIDGVLSTRSGYTGGKTLNPSYEDVSSGTTGHAEAVQVVYDPQKVSYESLLLTFWHNIDPTVRDRQFCDFGSQYRSAIFFHNEGQRRLAQESKKVLEMTRFKKPLETPIAAAGTFYPAEDYHQDYYLKNPVRYRAYRYSCGRDAVLRRIWGSSAGH